MQLENAHRPFQLILYFIQNIFHQKKKYYVFSLVELRTFLN